MLLLQPAAGGTQTKLSSEHAHRLFTVAGVANSYKHVDEWRNRFSAGCVEGVEAAVMYADIRRQTL